MVRLGMVSLLLLWCQFFTRETSASPPGANTIYVCRDCGNDSNTGLHKQSPVQSLNTGIALAAHHKISLVRAQGRFVLNSTLSLPQSLSATGITLDKWEGAENPIISGGIDIPSSAWLQLTATDGTANHEENVWTAKLDARASASINSTASIYVNGERRWVVRSAMKRWNASLVPNKKNQKENMLGFVYTEGDIDPAWSLEPAALQKWTVAAYHSWTKAYHSVRAVFPANRTILFSEAALFAYGDYVYSSDRRWYIEGVLEMPLTEGSWRYTERTDSSGLRELQYRPTAAELEQFRSQRHSSAVPPAPATAAAASMSPVSVTVPAVKQLVVVNNVNNVQLKNFRLMHTNDGDCSNGKVGKACDADGAAMAHAALTFQHSHGAAVSNCTFDSLGGWALQMIQSDNASVQRVAMRNVGAGGANLHSSRNMVMNNSYIKGFGQRYPAGEGINMANCLNGTVSHNSISGGHYNGLSGGGNFDAAAYSAYEYNLVFDNGFSGEGNENESGICDYGGWHGSTSGSKLPLYFRGNVIRNITAFHNGGDGIYMDVSSTAMVVEGNLVHDTTGAPLVWNVNPGVPMANGSDAAPTLIQDNVLVKNTLNSYYNDSSQIGSQGAIRWAGYTPATFRRNVVYVDFQKSPDARNVIWGNPCAAYQGPQDAPEAIGADTAGAGAGAGAAGDGKPGQLPCTWDYSASFAPRGDTDVFESNLYWNTSASAEGIGATFPGGCTLPADKQHWSFGLPTSCSSFSQWQQKGFDAKSVIADPQFKMPGYEVTSKAAIAAGIKPLQLKSVGPDWEYV